MIEELEAQNTRIPELEATIQEMEDRIWNLRNRLPSLKPGAREKDLQTEVDRLNEVVHQQQHRIEELEGVEAENAELREQLAEANAAIVDWDATIVDMQAAIDALDSETDRLRDTINQLKDQLCNYENQVERLKKDNFKIPQKIK